MRLIKDNNRLYTNFMKSLREIQNQTNKLKLYISLEYGQNEKERKIPKKINKLLDEIEELIN